MTIKYATQTTAATNSVRNETTPNLKSLFEKHFETPEILVEKTRAATFVPANFRVQTRSDASVENSTMIIFDIDQNPGDDIISLEEMEDALFDLNLEHFIYTSHSHTLEAPRFRVVMSVSRPFYAEEHNAILAAQLEQLDEFLDGRLLKVLDRCWKVQSQCYYVYTVHPARQNQAISFFNPGSPADVDELKMHGSTYGIEHEYKPGAARKSNSTLATRGRSYELNRIIGGMLSSSTEAEITKRMFEVDSTEHSDAPYFRDMQYPRNRPRPGESLEVAAWRSCVIFTKSHINSLRRKIIGKKIDTTINNQKSQSKEPMPTHDALIKIRSVKPQTTKKGAETHLMELQVMSGEHAGRHFWHRFYGAGNSDFAIKISESIKNKLGTATHQNINELKDLIKAEGKFVQARIKHKPGTNGFPAQNEIGDLHFTQ